VSLACKAQRKMTRARRQAIAAKEGAPQKLEHNKSGLRTVEGRGDVGERHSATREKAAKKKGRVGGKREGKEKKVCGGWALEWKRICDRVNE